MRTPARSRGFTLLEVLVTVGVLAIMIVGMLNLLDSAGRVSKEQTNLTDAQSSSRSGIFEVSRVLRQARVGQLFYENAIVPYAQNANGETIKDLNGTDHTLRPGTDAIDARGVIYGPNYFFAPGDITCSGGNCSSGSNDITVTIEQKTAIGVVNYPSGSLPPVANQTEDFYFVVCSSNRQKFLASNGNPYDIPLYYVGKVSASGSGWYTKTGPPTETFTFHMDATDSGALLLNAMKYDATTNPAPTLLNPFSGGMLDRVVFFVDQGAKDVNGLYTHPFLSQALFNPRTGNWNVQPVADDVEDLQIAYGIDGTSVTGAGGPVSTYDRGVNPGLFVSAVYDDLGKAVKTANDGMDEWVGNGATEKVTVPSAVGGTPTVVEAFIDKTYIDPATPSDPNTPPVAVPALKSIMIGLVVKSHEPDLKYQGPGAFGVKLFNSGAASISAMVPNASDTDATHKNWLRYRRRVQTMAVNLRNYL